MCRPQGAGADWSAFLGEAARTPGVLPAPPPLLDLSGPGLYLVFFGQTLDFAVFRINPATPLRSTRAYIPGPALWSGRAVRFSRARRAPNGFAAPWRISSALFPPNCPTRLGAVGSSSTLGPLWLPDFSPIGTRPRICGFPRTSGPWSRRTRPVKDTLKFCPGMLLVHAVDCVQRSPELR